ncbi:AraC family transcriptional regulator [Rhodocytophaga rosea]|uniref:AraC family transcriptional regulator n=1 Tax=Rhodocytophaga rosea TaxID=2704465 RepID=A0A6C0GPC4_9BACT|nr:helix-turn-helix domain-containing protein [Rhodocytophaga rosea]QHT69463.1 AraC family transcriptional regulator [Rhodocytophaga rosea]
MPTHQIFLDFLSVINFLGVVQGLFLAVIFLFAKQSNKLANRILALMLFCFSADILEIWLCYTGYIYYVPWLINTTESFAFMYGPLILLYTLALTKPGFAFQKKHLLYFIPAVAYLIHRIPFYLQSNAFKLYDVSVAYQRNLVPRVKAAPIWWFPHVLSISGELLDILVFIWSVIFNLISLRMVYLYTRKHHTNLFATDNIQLNWLVRTSIYLTSIFVVFAAFSFTDTHDLGDIYIATAISVIFYAITFQVVIHSQVLSAGHQVQEPKKKYEKSTLQAEQAEKSLKKLLAYMETEKPYLNSELGQGELAEALSLSTHHLSQLINEQLKLNFFDFINRYRVEEIKRKLHDPKLAHLKIEEIAFETGFNSKSAFNTAFKKFTQTTPSQFRKEANISQ